MKYLIVTKYKPHHQSETTVHFPDDECAELHSFDGYAQMAEFVAQEAKLFEDYNVLHIDVFEFQQGHTEWLSKHGNLYVHILRQTR